MREPHGLMRPNIKTLPIDFSAIAVLFNTGGGSVAADDRVTGDDFFALWIGHRGRCREEPNPGAQREAENTLHAALKAPAGRRASVAACSEVNRIHPTSHQFTRIRT